MTLEQKEQAFITLVTAILPRFITDNVVDRHLDYSRNKLWGQVDALEQQVARQAVSMAVSVFDDMDKMELINDPEAVNQVGV